MQNWIVGFLVKLSSLMIGQQKPCPLYYQEDIWRKHYQAKKEYRFVTDISKSKLTIYTSKSFDYETNTVKIITFLYSDHDALTIY